MLSSTLIHPQILESLGRAGHGSKVLLADGNYPVGTTLGPRSRLVHLNLAPGLLGVTPVLKVLLTAIPVEAATVMDSNPVSLVATADDPPVWQEFSAALGQVGVTQLDRLERYEFYEAAGSTDVALTVATGEQRVYANLLLTVGLILPETV